MNKEEYKEFLRSDYWKSFSKEIREKHGRCQDCGKEHRLNVHHLTYDRLGQEKEEDVVVLCKWCHTLRHLKNPKIIQCGRENNYNKLSKNLKRINPKKYWEIKRKEKKLAQIKSYYN